MPTKIGDADESDEKILRRLDLARKRAIPLDDRQGEVARERMAGGQRYVPSHVPRRPSKSGRKTSTGAKPSLRVAVTERALLQRINRALPRGQALKVARGKAGRRFYLAKGRTVLEENVDIDTLARRLSVLKPFEYLPEIGSGSEPNSGRPALIKEAGAAWPSNVGVIRGWAQPSPNQMPVMRRTRWTDTKMNESGEWETRETDITK